MNELVFLSHIIAILVFTLVCSRLGKTALSTWISLQAVCANLFVLKQTVLFGFHVTCSDAFAVGGILGLNLLQERYGVKAAQKTGAYCFCFMLFFVLLSQLHLLYSPAPCDTAHSAYTTLLSSSPRLFLASLTTFFLVQKIDISLFRQLKLHKPSASFAARSFTSLIISQGLDTLLFTYLGLYGLVSNLFDMALLSFFVKVLIICIFSPMLHLSRKWIQPKELPT